MRLRPFETQVESRENIFVRRTGTGSYLAHGWDAVGRLIEQQTKTPEGAAAAKPAAEVGMG